MLKILKFGGSSLANAERINNVANIIENEVIKGYRLIIVVSAMYKATDKLTNLTEEITNKISPAILAEKDVVISSGEQISSGLLAIALLNKSLKVRSWQGWQVPIIASINKGKALIQNIDIKQIEQSLTNGEIAIVSGFQAIDQEARITTLGRGGSDTTALALAAAFNLKYCDIYTDVEGIYSADPNIIKEAKKIEIISYEEALEMASSGAKVIHPRAVELARNYNININIVSSLKPQSIGTVVTATQATQYGLEHNHITGISLETKEYKVHTGLVSKIQLDKLFQIFTDYKVMLDLLILNNNHLSFNIKIDDYQIISQELKSAISFELNKTYKISIIGSGFKRNFNIINKIYKILQNNQIKFDNLIYGEIKLSFNFQHSNPEKFLQILHQELFN